MKPLVAPNSYSVPRATTTQFRAVSLGSGSVNASDLSSVKASQTRLKDGEVGAFRAIVLWDRGDRNVFSCCLPVWSSRVSYDCLAIMRKWGNSVVCPVEKKQKDPFNPTSLGDRIVEMLGLKTGDTIEVIKTRGGDVIVKKIGVEEPTTNDA